MKKFFTTLFSILVLTGVINAQWVENDLETGEYSNKMHVFNSDTAIISGNGAYVFRTDDGGETWNQTTLNLSNSYEYKFMDIDFANESEGYLVSTKVNVDGTNENGIVMKSADNGETWDEITLSAFSDGSDNPAIDPAATNAAKVSFSAIEAEGSSVYVAVDWEDTVATTSYTYIFKSEDKGATWESVSTDLGTININAIEADGSMVYFAGSSGTFMKSEDGGTNWTDYSDAGMISVNDVTLIDANTFYLPTTAGTYYSEDGGETLEQLNSEMAFDIVAFPTEDVILAGGLSTKTFRSVDDGVNWEAANRELATSAFEFELFNGKIYALCSGGLYYTINKDEIKDLELSFSYELLGAKLITSNETQNAGSYKWEPGEEEIYDTENIEHIYNDYNTYNVKLIAENAVMIDSVEQEVTIEEPVADFSYVLEDGNNAIFTNNSENCAEYEWEFDNLNTSQEENPSYAFGYLGDFTVTLSADNYIETVKATSTVSIDSIGVPWSSNTANTSQILQKLYNFDDQNAILAGNSTTILYTSDGGQTWEEAEYPSEYQGHIINDVVFFDDETGLISCSASGSTNGFVLKTTDQGRSWTPVTVDAFSDGSGDDATDPAAGQRVYFFSMAQTDDNNSFVVLRWEDAEGAKHGYVYKTEDKGETWSVTSGDIFSDYNFSSFINCFDFADDGQTGYIGGNNYLLKTENSGDSWENLSSDDLGYINDIVVMSPDSVFLATGNGVLKTSDGFDTWEQKTTDYSFDVIAVDENTIIAGKDGSTLKLSKDLGENWESFGSGVEMTFFELAHFNNKIYALSIMGTYYTAMMDNIYEPVADFEFSIDDLTAEFTNNCEHFKNYIWNFDDGGTSTESNPEHNYDDYGTYNVTLKGGNLCKTDSITKEITLVEETTGIDDAGNTMSFKIYPTPVTNNTLNIEIEQDIESKIYVEIYDIIGNKISEDYLEENCSHSLYIDTKPGVYIIQIKSDKSVISSQKFIVQ